SVFFLFPKSGPVQTPRGGGRWRRSLLPVFNMGPESEAVVWLKTLGGARNNKSPVQSDTRLGRPMKPFRRWRDEPVSRAATELFTGRSLGAFAMKQSPVQRSRPSP